MILNPLNAKLEEIMVDPYNPRFIKIKNTNQSDLISEMLESKSSKELLRSLQEDIKWVNRIVVQKIDTHEYSTIIDKKREFKYVVVEGNTRLSCLKSGLIKGYSEKTEIPVLLALIENDKEDINEFRKQIRITQGIANVTVVKEWSPISKAKHLTSLYNDVSSKLRPAEIYKQIANELGIGTKEARESVIRYLIYDKISKLSESISEDNWGYLEAFDKNSKIRSIIGLDTENNIFIENDEEYYTEIIEDIPNLIRQALSQGLNTKQFRDIITEISKTTKDSSEFNEIKDDILDDKTDVTLISKIKKLNTISDKEIWSKDLDEMLKKISSFPNMADWASDFESKLKEIKEKIEKQLKAL
jgi:hypothetical protein